MTEEAAQVWRLWSAVRESTAALAGSSQLAAALGRAAEDETRVCGLQERMGPWTRCHGLWEAFRTVVSEGMRNTKRADVVNIDGKVGVEDEIHGLLLACAESLPLAHARGISSGKLGYLPRKYLIGFLFGVSFCLLLKTITNNYTVCTYEYVGTYVHVKKGKVVNLNQKPHSKRPELQLRMH